MSPNYSVQVKVTIVQTENLFGIDAYDYIHHIKGFKELLKSRVL